MTTKLCCSGFNKDLRRILTLSLLSGLVYGLATVSDTLFAGKLNGKEIIGALALFVIGGLALSMTVRLLTPLFTRGDIYLNKFKFVGVAFVTLTAVYPLVFLIFTQRSLSGGFLIVSLSIASILFFLLSFIWKHIELKTTWLISALVSAWLFYRIIDDEGLLVRAGQDIFDLPSIVLFLISGGTVAMSVLLVRLAQSLVDKPPVFFGAEAAFSFACGMAIVFLAPGVIYIHYQTIYQASALFSFIAVIYGLSAIRVYPPIKLLAPVTALILMAGLLFLVPFNGKPKGLTLSHSGLAEKNRTIAEVFRTTGLAAGKQKAAVCKLSKISNYPKDDFVQRFETSAKLAGHRPTAEELTSDPQRHILKQEKRWNFLFITVDSLRYDKTSYSGMIGKKVTPTLAALAEKSQRFHRTYPQGAWTSLSVPAFIWSKFPSQIEFTPLFEDRKLKLYLREELTDDIKIKKAFQVPLAEKGPNLPGMLSKSGLTTVAVVNDGRTGFFDPRLGLSKGFEKVYYAGKDGRDTKAVEMAKTALSSIKDKNFFLWVHLFDVHSCYRKPKDKNSKTWKKYNHRVKVADRNVGNILAFLEELALQENTIVILSADHGQSMGEMGIKGHGLALNEATLRVPLLIYVPGLEAKDYHQPVALVDLAPTVLDLAEAGENVPDVWAGTSLAPMLAAGKDIDHPPVYLENWRNKRTKMRKRLHLSGVVYEGLKATLQLDDMKLSFYDVSSLKVSEEKFLGSSLQPGDMSAGQFYMAKYLLDYNKKLVKRKCR